MFLAIDIGNTNIKAGLFNGQRLEDHFNITDNQTLKTILKKTPTTNIAISSVVPQRTEEIVTELASNFNSKPFIISKNSEFNLKLDYNTPETLGTDRICSAEGAFNLCGNNLNNGTYLLTIDFGTATTINIIKFPGNYIGGLITPGINTMFKSLKSHTSQLPELTIENFNSIIGKDTNSSIASGVINSTIGSIEKAIKHVRELKDCKKVITYVTGGMANKLQKFLPEEFLYEEFLVLRGIKSVFDLNKIKHR
jgi:type III pantothenate kinase